ncbi:MAG: serine hydrolase [Clostridia bacterium]|nr:serine hydrolase [Clostridia bacterium]
MSFSAFIRDIEQNHWNIFGVEVYRDSQLLHRWGDTNDHRHNTYSVTKSVTAIAAGMARDDGLFDFDRCVLDYLPGRFVAAMPCHQRELYRQITIRRLMTMSVPGYPFRPEGDSWLTASLAYPLPEPLERRFEYSNIPAYLVGVAVTEAIGEPLDDYLNRRLFRPLGIQSPVLAHCPDGYFYGASGMELTVHDLSQIGLLLQNGGVYGNQRILSEAFVREATSVQQMNREGGYGYFIWKYRDGFSFNGKWKQKCYILPKTGLVITFLGHIEEECAGLRASMERHLLDSE